MKAQIKIIEFLEASYLNEIVVGFCVLIPTAWTTRSSWTKLRALGTLQNANVNLGTMKSTTRS